ncbi:MAG: hypothetical protein SFX72_20785 [Isosphaeraceae bacterium]|nr:hypothetical protein [Isosphaeraceae bacterium]
MAKKNERDINFVNPTKKSLRLQFFIYGNYFGNSYLKLMDRAESMLREHGLDLGYYPIRGLLIPLALPHTSGPRGLIAEEDYGNIKSFVDTFMKATSTVETHLAVVLCNYTDLGHGLTPWKRFGWSKPLVLISPRPNDDNVTLLHELGHAADLGHEIDKVNNQRNFMDPVESRTTMYRFQVEKLAGAYFAG